MQMRTTTLLIKQLDFIKKSIIELDKSIESLENAIGPTHIMLKSAIESVRGKQVNCGCGMGLHKCTFSIRLLLPQTFAKSEALELGELVRSPLVKGRSLKKKDDDKTDPDGRLLQRRGSVNTLPKDMHKFLLRLKANKDIIFSLHKTFLKCGCVCLWSSICTMRLLVGLIISMLYSAVARSACACYLLLALR